MRKPAIGECRELQPPRTVFTMERDSGRAVNRRPNWPCRRRRLPTGRGPLRSPAWQPPPVASQPARMWSVSQGRTVAGVCTTRHGYLAQGLPHGPCHDVRPANDIPAPSPP